LSVPWIEILKDTAAEAAPEVRFILIQSISKGPEDPVLKAYPRFDVYVVPLGIDEDPFGAFFGVTYVMGPAETEEGNNTKPKARNTTETDTAKRMNES
jgi:hypothetical protein